MKDGSILESATKVLTGFGTTSVSLVILVERRTRSINRGTTQVFIWSDHIWLLGHSQGNENESKERNHRDFSSPKVGLFWIDKSKNWVSRSMSSPATKVRWIKWDPGDGGRLCRRGKRKEWESNLNKMKKQIVGNFTRYEEQDSVAWQGLPRLR